MHSGPSHCGLRRETDLPLAPRRGRWDTWSTTPPASSAFRASATTTSWDQGASTSSPRALTWGRGSRSPPARCAGLLPVDEKGDAVPRSHPGAPLREGDALVPGCPGHRAYLRRAVGRARLPAGGPRSGRDRGVPRLPAPCRRGRRIPLSRKLFAPSSRPPTTGTSRASASTASSDASTSLGRSCVSGSASTVTSPQWSGRRCSAARKPASGNMDEQPD